MPLMKTFSRPEISGMEAGAELDQRGDPAVDRRPCPVVGFVMPATSLSAVLLPDPFRPMTP